MNETVGLSVVCSLGYTIHAKLISHSCQGPFSGKSQDVTAQKCLIFRSRSKKTKKQFLAAKTVHLFSLLINLSYHLQNY